VVDERLPGDATGTEGEGETLDMPEGFQPFTHGQVLGERYQILEMLGRGGMGEVWQAFDLKLRVEVALKALREDFFKSERRLELLRQEVRAAREVMSPNVCRIFDLIEIEGRELVSMEYVDGATLLGVLQERGPLELKEAQDIASQFLAGLEAIHKVGLVHRDIKPENIMLTRAGRVVVMDFGLARQETEGGGSVSGTPAYMAPEQAAGQTLDPRADVYSAGVVLAEMVSPDGIKSFESRQSLWEGVRSEPAKLPDSPWAPVLKKAVAKDREGRYNTARTLTRALEDVTLRVEGAEDLHPYPGLASFTEEDAEYFFGREAEVEQMWRKLEGPARMLALVGPSGAGKTSFLQAGLFPTATAQWATAICKPGKNPQLALGRSLAPEMAGDTDVMDLLLRFDDPDVAVEVLSRWRGKNDSALLVVDQFEELFTQNSADEQQRFADLLKRLVLDSDVCVLLSMRDDFMIRCRDFEALQPTFADMTALPTLAGQALRRALVRPATKCGYRFEDDELVEEMLAEVEGERGALPLLAFALARLWETRDRETGLLTRQAYRDIGGVGGALALHAEATVDRIGTDRIAIVRELFRNLVTAEGTRSVRERNELLSVFEEPQRQPAEEVLRELIDARLLTSYEVREEDREPTRRVEIIHESLLANWPRLVRWQTQDADAAQLRAQLRQAARTWDEQGRTDDTLWTGSAYREFAVWRERYPGGLSELEETFAKAMESLATRRRRRRRIAVTTVIAVLLAGLAVVGTFWRRSVLQTRRTKAAQLLALAQLTLTDHPNAALAYAIASLESADNDPARRFALEALWQGPSALFLSGPNPWSAAWSPDGRWLAMGGSNGVELLERGTDRVRLLSPSLERIPGFTADSRQLVTRPDGEPPTFHVWSLPEAQLERTITLPERTYAVIVGDSLLTLTLDTPEPQRRRSIPARLLSLDGTTQRELGVWKPRGPVRLAFDPSGTWMFSTQESRIVQQPINDLTAPGRELGTHEGVASVSARPWRGRVVTGDGTGEVRIWGVDAARLERTLKSSAGASTIALGPEGRFLATSPTWSTMPLPPWLFLFDLASPREAEPAPLLAPSLLAVLEMEFSPDGAWLTTVGNGVVILWNLTCARSIVLDRQESPYRNVAFTPDGDVLGISGASWLRKWSLSPTADHGVMELWSRPGAAIDSDLHVSPDGRFAVVTERFAGTIFAVPLDGTQVSTYELKSAPGERLWTVPLDLDPSGRSVAVTIGHPSDPAANELRILDLATGEARSLDTQPDGDEGCEDPGSGNQGLAVPVWLPDGRLITDGDAGLRLWDLASGTSRLLRPCRKAHPSLSLNLYATPDSSRVLRLDPAFKAGETSSLSMFDLASGETSEITAHGNRLFSCGLDVSGTILVTASSDGVIRVGSLAGGEPHLLFGHGGAVLSVAVSPDAHSIASASEDGTIRLWPMPDLSRPPLHTLPHDELIAKLKSLTNLRVVRDEESSTGWKVEIGPFPGWAEVPEW